MLAVSQIGVSGGLGQRRILGLGQGLGAGCEQAGGIFEPRTQHGLEEGGGEFVVLPIGRVGMLGDGALLHVAGEPGGGAFRGFEIATSVGDQETDRRAAYSVDDALAIRIAESTVLTPDAMGMSAPPASSASTTGKAAMPPPKAPAPIRKKLQKTEWSGCVMERT